MTIYVDELRRYDEPPGRWCHMAAGKADDLAELHRLAVQIGLKREWFQAGGLTPHYDLVPAKRRLAIEAGAVEVTTGQLVKLCSRRVRKADRLVTESGANLTS